MSDLSKRIGARIRALREARGWTQGDLADASKITRVTVHNIEKGERSTDIDTLNALAKGLGTSLVSIISPESSGHDLEDCIHTVVTAARESKKKIPRDH